MCNQQQGCKRIFIQKGGYCVPAPVGINPDGSVAQMPRINATALPLSSPTVQKGCVMQESQYSGIVSGYNQNPNGYNVNAVGMANVQNLPGANTAVRTESVSGSGGQVYNIQMTLNGVGSDPRVLIGDAAGTWSLINNVPATTVTNTAGTFGTGTLTQFITRSGLVPFRVTKIQFIASNQSFFSTAILNWITTNPTGSGYNSKTIDLQNLITPDQFNATIQFLNESFVFDGSTCLDLTIPAGLNVVMVFTVESQATAHQMQRLN